MASKYRVRAPLSWSRIFSKVSDTDQTHHPEETNRRLIRSLREFPVLSKEWLGQVDTLKQLSQAVHAEFVREDDLKGGVELGHCINEEGGISMFDQEYTSIARLLVEEAKVTLCLRMLHHFKSLQYDRASWESTLETAAQTTGQTQAQLETKCRGFEQCVGLLLARACVHIETLQLLDVRLFLTHISMVLDYCDRKQQRENVCCETEQETMVLEYFACLMKHLEAINSSEVVSSCLEQRLLKLVMSHILNHATEYSEELSFSVTSGLSLLVDDEDFSTNWEQFFANSEGEIDSQQIDAFLQIEDLVGNLVAQCPTRRADLRPLTDFLGKLRRKFGQ